MKREYEEGVVAENVTYFVGTEVENSAAKGLTTLFTVGLHTPQEMIDANDDYFASHRIDHFYFGANQSFNPVTHDEWDQWDETVTYFLKKQYWVTLDFDIKYLEGVHEMRATEYNMFIPMMSVKVPYIKLCNYNTVLKIDDKGFNATNPGVWCHNLHDLMSTDKITRWAEYGKDQILK